MARILTIALVGLFVFACCLLVRTLLLGFYPDFSVYYDGSLSILHGENPYIRTSVFFSNYVYPPFVAMIFALFTLFPLPIASVIFTLLSIISYFLGLYFLLKSIHKFSLNSVLVFGALGILSFPTRFTLGMGQVNLLIFFLLCLALYYLEKRRDDISAILIGICFSIKFFPFLFLPYLLYQKKWRVVFVSLATLVFLSTLGFMLVGIDTGKIFLRDVMPGILSAYQSSYYNQALSGFLARLHLQREEGMYAKTVLSLIFVGITSLFLIKKSRHKRLFFDLSLLITLSLIVNPFSWQHHFVWLMIPFIMTYYAIPVKNIFWIFVLILSYILVSINFSSPEKLGLVFQSHVIFGTILLWLVQLRCISARRIHEN